MAKNTQKENAMAMFNNTAIVKPNKTEPVKEEKQIKQSEPKKEASTVPEEVTSVDEAKEQAHETIKSVVIEEPVKHIELPEKVDKEISLTIEKKPLQKGLAKTFYIRTDLDEKITEGAKRSGVSRSEYLNYILEQVL